MTVREIAEAVGKNPATVARWVEKTSRKMQEVSRKVQEAKATSKPADYTEAETIAIIREGMGEVPAGVYQAAASPTAPRVKLPNGTQLRELRMIYGPTEAARRLDAWIGFTDIDVVTIPIAENIGRIGKVAYAVEMKERQKHIQRQIEYNSTPDLFR